MKFIFPFFILMPLLQVTAQPFPPMETETLTEATINIPSDLEGKFSLIGLAYSKKAEEDLKSWFSPGYNQFIRPPDKNDIFASTYDINLYFIPMVTGHKTVAYKKVMKKVKAEIDEELHPHVLFYKGSLKEYKKVLGLKRNEPYFLLMNANGDIIWRTTGRYSPGKMQEIVDHLDDALGGW